MDVYEELLKMLLKENELNYAEMNKDRKKMDEIDKGISHVLQKKKSKAVLF